MFVAKGGWIKNAGVRDRLTPRANSKGKLSALPVRTVFLLKMQGKKVSVKLMEWRGRKLWELNLRDLYLFRRGIMDSC